MKICVFGLGYVGCVSLACLANEGHELTGIDVDANKIDMINKGIPTIIEKDIDVLLKRGWERGRINATKDYKAALRDADASIICVGTPNSKTGHLDMSYIYRVAENIAQGLANNNKFHVVIARSTVLPGTNEVVGTLIEEHSHKKRTIDFEVVSNPEFMREGCAVQDFYGPYMTVIGTTSDRAFEIVKEIYKNIKAPVRRTSIKAAELIKLVNNSFHALKVTFANEIGGICKYLEIDSYEVMQIFCEDKKLNLSPYYLKPGFSYGGSCLPKDLKALTIIGHDSYLESPVLESIERSNEVQKKRLVDLVVDKGYRSIGILGLSFKAGTDDLRNSPLVEVTERLIGKGYTIKIYDKNVHLANLIGSNKRYIDEKIPHLEDLISDDLNDVINSCGLLVIANKENEFNDLPVRFPNKFFIDLVRIDMEKEVNKNNYLGICW